MEKVERGYIPEKLLFDTRLVDMNLRKSFISQEELEQHINSLEDVSENVVPLESVDPIVLEYTEDLNKKKEEEVESETL